MSFNNIGSSGDMNINIFLGEQRFAAARDDSFNLQSLQQQISLLQNQLGFNSADRGALQDLRDVSRDVETLLRQEASKECFEQDSPLETLEDLLGQVLELLVEHDEDQDQDERQGSRDGRREGNRDGCRGGHHEGNRGDGSRGEDRREAVSRSEGSRGDSNQDEGRRGAELHGRSDADDQRSNARPRQPHPRDAHPC